MMLERNLKRDLCEFYDRDAGRCAKRGLESWKAEHRKAFLNTCQKAEVDSLLEIGSCIGRDSLYFKQKHLRTFPTDLSSTMAAHCLGKKLPASRMDCCHLGFPDETFDAVWSLNALLHVPKIHVEAVWTEVKRGMRPDAIFFLGVYGGPDQEGIFEDDLDEPKRFFSFFPDEDIQKLIRSQFELLSFERTDTGEKALHSQALVLRKA